jgi:glycosyltransferase involved in cell wall biosynthesis
MAMLKIAMLLDNDFVNDRRVQREAQTLVSVGYDLTLYAVKSESLPEEEVANGVKVKRIFDPFIGDIKVKAISCVRKMAESIAAQHPDILHCHDQAMLNVGTAIKKISKNVTLVYDSHELFHLWPLNYISYASQWIRLKSYIVRKCQIYRERKNGWSIDYLITVNDSLAEILRRYLNLREAPLVLRNIPERVPVPAKNDVIRKAFGISLDRKVIVFIGLNIYRHSLNLETVFDQIAPVPNLSLVVICGERGNKKELVEYVRSRGYGNIYFHPLLKPSEINQYLASCDLGLVPTWNRKDMSYWYALDNKLFEYISAGIPVLATQQPEYKNIVEKHNVGVCVNPDEPLAYRRGAEKILSGYTAYSDYLKRAVQELNWEQEQRKLLELYQKIERRRESNQAV